LRFGRAIQSRRYELGFSQEEVAERAGLHRTYISDIERGSRNPSLESIEKLAIALDISMTELFQRMTDPAGAGRDGFPPTEGRNHTGKENSVSEPEN